MGTCSAGTPTTVNSSGAWSCVGSGGGSTATCSSSTPPPPATFTMGETACFADFDTDSANALARNLVHLSQAGTLQSLSICLGPAAGQGRLGVYNSSGNIVVQTAVFTPVSGVNTVQVGQVPLAVGDYWLAWFFSSPTTGPGIDRTSGTAAWTSRTFGAMPSTLPAPSGTPTEHWSISATLK